MSTAVDCLLADFAMLSRGRCVAAAVAAAACVDVWFDMCGLLDAAAVAACTTAAAAVDWDGA